MAVSIISILASVAVFTFNDVRKESRDKIRMNDIEQLELTFRLFVAQYGPDIDCNGGLKIDGNQDPAFPVVYGLASNDCPSGQDILTFIQSASGAIPHDPLGPGNPDYYYYFDNVHDCDNYPQGTMLFAVNLESMPSNAATVCGNVAENDGGYMNTSVDNPMAAAGGTINPSLPYVRLLHFTEDDS